MRIKSVSFFDDTSGVGACVSLLDFATLEMKYAMAAFATTQYDVYRSPVQYKIGQSGTNIVREYAISQVANLKEISEVLAENSPRYIVICYVSGEKRYFEYNEEFCKTFNIAAQFKPTEQPPKSDISSKEPVCPIPPVSQVKYTRPAAKSPKKTISWPKILAVLAACVLVIVLLIPKEPEDPNAGLTPVDEPRSGEVLAGQQDFYGSEITVNASSGEACVVKLKTSAGLEKLSFYVRAGDSVTIHVPDEKLYVYFASGKTWYGKDQLFGAYTSYSMDDEICDFTRYTWEYTLYPVTDGNFSQTPIDASEF